MESAHLFHHQPHTGQGRLVHRTCLVVALVALTMSLSGCSFLFETSSEQPAATPIPARSLAPTFTPTPLAQLIEPAPAPTTITTPVTNDTPTATPAPVSVNDAAPTPTSAPAPRLTITGDLVNLRSGPGVSFDLVGTAAKDQVFDLVARNATGDWWEVCCLDGQSAWVFGELALVENAGTLPIAAEIGATAVAVAVTLESKPESTPPPAAPTDIPAPLPTTAPAAAAPDPSASSAGFFDPNAQYQIVHFKVLGLDENNGGIRDSSAQHLIFLTVLDANGNGVDGAVVRNLVGDKSEVSTGAKGPGKAEITMYYEPFKLTVVSDPSGAVTSQVSNQMGLVFPHLPDLVGKLGDVNYEYGACPTLEIRCQWPIQAIHFSYEITFQKVK